MRDVKDSIAQDRRRESLLLNRARHDLLADIKADSVEAFSFLYSDYERINRLIPGRADAMIGWADNNLILSASKRGRRADQLTQILASQLSDESAQELSRDLRVPSNA